MPNDSRRTKQKDNQPNVGRLHTLSLPVLRYEEVLYIPKFVGLLGFGRF